MTEEILINVTRIETRVAVVENGVLQELSIERTSKKGVVGNIYMGKIVRVLPGMQAAFVDIGFEKAAFLHLNDMITVQNEDISEIHFNGQTECISDILTEGQRLFVQVTKDPLGSKGARLTTRISLASRNLVFMPDLNMIGISQKIEDETERQRLKALLERKASSMGGGYIVRTAAEGVNDDIILADQAYLTQYWEKLREAMKRAKVGDALHEEMPLYLRVLRDWVTSHTERVRIDSKDVYEHVVSFVKDFIPALDGRVEHYKETKPLFDQYHIEEEIQKALERQVVLKSGAHLVFDQTESMTTIDVNTGAFVGHRNQEDTIFKTNLEAASTIARQLRLRNLGGIIIIDFIDMTDENHKRQVVLELEKAMSRDHSKTKISNISSLGLVEMTRKRTQESLAYVLCEVCPLCQARGHIKTAETICHEIFREVMRTAGAYGQKNYLVLASQAVVDRMLDEESVLVSELEAEVGQTITFQVESLYMQEQFDVVLM